MIWVFLQLLLGISGSPIDAADKPSPPKILKPSLKPDLKLAQKPTILLFNLDALVYCLPQTDAMQIEVRPYYTLNTNLPYICTFHPSAKKITDMLKSIQIQFFSRRLVCDLQTSRGFGSLLSEAFNKYKSRNQLKPLFAMQQVTHEVYPREDGYIIIDFLQNVDSDFIVSDIFTFQFQNVSLFCRLLEFLFLINPPSVDVEKVIDWFVLPNRDMKWSKKKAVSFNNFIQKQDHYWNPTWDTLSNDDEKSHDGKSTSSNYDEKSDDGHSSSSGYDPDDGHSTSSDEESDDGHPTWSNYDEKSDEGHPTWSNYDEKSDNGFSMSSEIDTNA